jgi:uncharacterized membrane protein
MILRKGWTVALPILGAMLAASAYVLGALPPAARVATHFGIDGQPDSWSAAWFGVSIMPAAALLVSILIPLLPHIDPRWQNIERSALALVSFWTALMIVLAVTHAVILLVALGQPVDIGRLLIGALGLLFLVTGNFFGKIRANYSFGLRTPWTLADERVWDKTHRFAGRLLFLAGAVMVAAALLPLAAGLRAATALLPLLVLLLAAGKSYLLWRDERPAS